jgi:adenosine deaminase
VPNRFQQLRSWIWRPSYGLRIFLALVLAGIVALIAAAQSDTLVTAAKFNSLRGDYTALRAFLHRMPKGGDLHVHLSGAVFAEQLIAWAAQDGLCLRPADTSIVEAPCDAAKGTLPMAQAAGDQKTYDHLIDALSTRSFVPSAAVPSGHDQFFAAFAKFGAATGRHFVDMTLYQLRQYETDSVQYAEFMASFFSYDERKRLIDAVKGQTDFPAMLAALKGNGLDDIVAAKRAEIAGTIDKLESSRNCRAASAAPGCKVAYRFIAQVSRNSPREDVFVQTALAAALIRAEPHIVAGLNFVAPEDYQVALRDYAEHMRMVGFLASDVPVALHAGELWGGLVPPADLSFHIRQAVEVAGARRIGHGVALAYEQDMEGLLDEMRRRQVAVEINLTSNDKILDVRGKDHPLPTYLAAGVPVVISTDDAGVSRIDLANEYFRAARDYGLGYRGLKAVARNALVFSFLDENAKQKELERFEQSCAAFERAEAGRQSLLRNVTMLLTSFVDWR